MAIFETGGALHPEEHFHIMVQRPELDRILAHIQNDDLYVALQSPRQTGKTTLLYQIQARLHGHGYGAVYLDLSGLSDLRKAQFYQKICADIWEGLCELTDATAEAALNPQQVTDQTSFCDYLTRISDHTPKAQKLVLMLDEVGGVPEATALTFFPSIRSFFQRGRRQSRKRDLYRKVAFIFTGALDMQQLMKGVNSPLRNVCEHFSLNDFSREQVCGLASNLKGFPPEAAEAVADIIHGWCNGHPYLTQRLYALIEASQECHRARVDQLPQLVDQFVAMHFLYGNDANLTHIFNYLQEGEAYRDQIFAIFKREKRRSVMHAADLLSIGIIKRSNDQHLVIRNKVYEKALSDFFDEVDRK